MKNLFFSRLYRNALILGALLIICLSCDKIRSKLKIQKEKKVEQLTEASMYNYALVQKVVEASDEDKKYESKKLFLEGINLYKKNQRFQSLEYLKKSILTYPNPKSYYELGNVALEMDFYSQAIVAYKMAEKLEYQPLSKLYYKLSTAYSSQSNVALASTYLKRALDLGYSDIKRIAVDPHLKNLKGTEEYRALMADKVPQEKDRKVALFDLFISGFPQVKLPFAIDNVKVKDFHYEKYIPYDYEEILINTSDGDDSKEYSYVAKLAETEKYVAVIYASIDATSETLPIIENYINVYDKKGNLLDKKLFACTCTPDITLAGKIDDHKDIKLTEYRTTWKYDPDVVDYPQNKIDTTVVRAEYFFKLTEDGRIKEVEKKDGDRAIARI